MTKKSFSLFPVTSTKDVSSKTVAPKNKSTTPVEPEPIKSKKESKTQKSVVAKVTETPKKKVVIIEDDDEDEPSDNITQKSNNTQKKRKAESNNEEPKKKKQKLENEGESKPKILSRRLGKRSGDKVMKYRKKILDAYKKCVVTGNDIEEVNMAVPILDWALIPIDVPISNTGLILRNDWAYLFKKQAWSVDEEHKIVLSHKMKTDNYYSKFEGKSLLLPEDSKWSPDAELLKHQRKLATSKHKK